MHDDLVVLLSAIKLVAHRTVFPKKIMLERERERERETWDMSQWLKHLWFKLSVKTMHMNNSSSSLGPHLQRFKARATSAGKVPQKLLLVKRREMYRYTDRGETLLSTKTPLLPACLWSQTLVEFQWSKTKERKKETEIDSRDCSLLLRSCKNVWTKCESDSDFVNELLQRQMMMIRSVAICVPKIRTWRSFATLCNGQ